MGKGSRNKSAKQAVAEIKRQQQLQAAIERKKKIRNNIIVAVLCVVLTAGFIGGLIGYVTARDNGTFLRSETALKTENFEIDGTTFNYFFNNQFQNYITQNKDYLTYEGLDVNTSLRDQERNDGENWFDYMVAQTEKNLKEILYFAEKAKEAGYELTDEDKKDIDKVFEDLEKTAEEQKVTVKEYISTMYGQGVLAKDVRAAIELETLASKYLTDKVEKLEYTDKEIEDYFNKNDKDFLMVDYKYYTFTPATSSSMTTEQKEAAKLAAKKSAEKLMKATSPEEFESILTDILRSDKMSDDDIKKALANTAVEGSIYDKEFGVSVWAFGNDAKLYGTKMHENGTTYGVYMLTKLPYRDESETRSVRHILISLDSYKTDAESKKKAEEVLKEYNDGKKTEESFAALVEKNTDDPGSISNGGLYENFGKGEMVAEFENWAFDSKRKKGDVEIVKTTYGYHVMYFVAKGDPAWKGNVVNQMKSDVYDGIVEECDKKYNAELNADILPKLTELKVAPTSTTTSAS